MRLRRLPRRAVNRGRHFSTPQSSRRLSGRLGSRPSSILGRTRPPRNPTSTTVLTASVHKVSNDASPPAVERWRNVRTQRRRGLVGGSPTKTRVGRDEPYVLLVKSAPNPYEAPRCQETDYPRGADFGFFPPDRSWRSRPRVPCSDCISLYVVQTAHVGTKHVWRFSRHGAGECRDACVSAP